MQLSVEPVMDNDDLISEVRWSVCVEWKWNAQAICCLFISRSLFFFSRCITQSVFRLLSLLNDEYTLPPPAGKESYCHSRMRSSYVLLGRRLKSLRCVPVRHMAKTQRREATQQSGSVCVSSLLSDWCVRAFRGPEKTWEDWPCSRQIRLHPFLSGNQGFQCMLG